MPRREVRTQIDIDASPEEVWATVRDLARWPEWNPVVRKIRADLEPGAIVRFKIKLVGPSLPLTARLLVADENREIRWRGPPQEALGVIVAGEHYVQLEPSADGTRVIHGETFTGALVPLLWWWLEPLLSRRYNEMNRALRRRVESR